MPYTELQFGALRCLLSVPLGVAPETGWPVIVFLHGRDEAAPVPVAQALTRHGPLSPRASSVATSGFIVVAPQLPAPGGDVWAARSDLIVELAEEMVSAQRGDRSRLYLSGFSFGGNGVLDIGPKTTFWAALWPVDPTRPVAPAGDQPVWISGGDRSRARAKRLPGFVEPQPGARRVLHDAGLNHVETAARAYQDDAVYSWLLSHSCTVLP